MYYAKIRKYDITNGPGVRTTIFVSGCTHKCKGCFNSKAQSFTFGNEFTKEVEDKFIEYVKDDNVVGVNVLGGEPMQQDNSAMFRLVKRIKEETGKSIWMWTGCLFEDLIKDDNKLKILEYVDVLIDGKFELANRNLMLQYRGSSNQRIINVSKSLSSRKVIKHNIDKIC